MFEFGIFRMIAQQIQLRYSYNDDRWANASEKSAAAIRREDEAKDKFDHLKSQMELALYENTMTMIGLAIHAKESNKSPLKLLSSDVMEHVLGFAACTKPMGASVKSIATGRTGGSLAIVPFEGWGSAAAPSKLRSEKKNAPDEAPLNLADMSMYQPGCKIIIPLTKPNLHLTGPCYRDLRKHVKSHANWDVQRTAATPQEKRQYKETRRGKVYFINVIYKVPGKVVAGKRKRETSTATTAAAASGGKRKSPLEALSSEMQANATSVLQAAIQSAANDANGNVEPEVFQRALDAGYSKHFIYGKMNLDSIKDTKPPAKKMKAEE